MKPSVILFVLVCGVIVGGLILLKHHQPAPAPTPVAELHPSEPATPASPTSETIPPQPAQSTPTPAAKAAEPAQPVAAVTNEPSPIARSVDALLHAKSGAEKHELFQQLIKSGQLDQAIAELSRRVTESPGDAEIPTTLGEAQLNKIRALKESGDTDQNDMGILAMQADKNFNAALKSDPKNWEAQFMQAASRYYWPADLNRDAGVVQQLSSLIDQQEASPQRPEFAQTYVVLGNEYQKIGQPDKAAATWQLGLQKFPTDPTLQKKAASTSH